MDEAWLQMLKCAGLHEGDISGGSGAIFFFNRKAYRGMQ